VGVAAWTDRVLVALPLGDPGDEDLPDPARAEPPHRMHAAVPQVEVADDADAFGVGRPDGEVHAVGLADAHQVRAELLVDTRMAALCGQAEVGLGDDAAVAIRGGDPRD